jgi:hypothetical protein
MFTTSFVSHLEPRYDSRKSFYGKAIVKQKNGIIVLQSYETDVAAFNPESGKMTLCAYASAYSRTTCRHVWEFMRQIDEANKTHLCDFYSNWMMQKSKRSFAGFCREYCHEYSCKDKPIG